MYQSDIDEAFHRLQALRDQIHQMQRLADGTLKNGSELHLVVGAEQLTKMLSQSLAEARELRKIVRR